MLIEKKNNEVPEWSVNKYLNRWCDYIELRCLKGTDNIITKDDVISWLLEGREDSGQENHASYYDKLSEKVDLIFEQINFRSKAMKKFYPFDYDNECLSRKNYVDKYMIQYLFLLISSSLAFLDKSSMTKITKDFEEYCKYIFNFLVSKDSQVYIFGTSRKNAFFSGNLRTRIEKLAKSLGAQTTKTFDKDKQYDVSGGDEGIDLVAFNKIDNASHIPVALGQCTCSYTQWEIKQEEINQDAWVQKIMPLAPFGKYMFVSFFCRDANGKFENETTITTCLIDRMRILKIIERHEDEIYTNISVKEQLKKIECYCGNEFSNSIKKLCKDNMFSS